MICSPLLRSTLVAALALFILRPDAAADPGEWFRYARRIGTRTEGIAVHQRAIDEYVAAGRWIEAAHAGRSQARLHAFFGQLDEAGAALETALARLEKGGSRTHGPEFRLELAEVHRRKGHLDEALALSEKVLEAARGEAHTELVFRCLLFQETVLGESGDLTRAIECRREAERMARQHGHDGARPQGYDAGALPHVDPGTVICGDPGIRTGRFVARAPPPSGLAAATSHVQAMQIVGARFVPQAALEAPEKDWRPPAKTTKEGPTKVRELERDYRTLQKSLSYYRLVGRFQDTVGDPKELALLYADLAYLGHNQDTFFEGLFYGIKGMTVGQNLVALVTLAGTGMALDLRILAISKALADVIRRYEKRSRS